MLKFHSRKIQKNPRKSDSEKLWELSGIAAIQTGNNLDGNPACSRVLTEYGFRDFFWESF